jgi:hypothetical protein
MLPVKREKIHSPQYSNGLPPSINDPNQSDSESEPEDEDDEDSNGKWVQSVREW